MAEKTVNIRFPIVDDTQNNFLFKMNRTTAEAIKSDLTFLILTQKGQRWYYPQFGTNLKRFLFEPNDDVTDEDIKRDIKDTVARFIPNVRIDDVIIPEEEKSEQGILVQIQYTITEQFTNTRDTINIRLTP